MPITLPFETKNASASSPEALLPYETKNASFANGTVKAFLLLLSSKLTQYDMKLQVRQPNIYRLGHYLGAAEKVEKDLASQLNESSPEALGALKASLLKRFTSRGGKSDLPPVTNVLRQIDAFLAEGTLPSITRRAGMKFAARYVLSAKVPGATVEFGTDRASGRFFQLWASNEAQIDEERLSQGDVIALLRQHGKPSPDLKKAIEAVALDVEPSTLGVRRVASEKAALVAPEKKIARFTEGPEGEKEWTAWFKSQPEDFQKRWQEENDKHKDNFKGARFTEGPEGAKEFQAWFDSQPEDFQATWKEENDKHKDKFKNASDLLPVELSERTAADKEAGIGLYGYPKRTQADVEATIRKASRRAAAVAKAIYAKDNQTLPFLQVHAKRGKSASARLLLDAMDQNGLKVASLPGLDPSEERLFDELFLLASNDGRSYAKRDAEGAVASALVDYQKASRIELQEAFKAVRPLLVRELSKRWSETDRTAATKGSMGMYGFPSKTARLALTACADFKSFVGEVGYDLHSRRADAHDKITGFMKEHSKKCGYAKMILGCYPDVASSRLASEKVLGASPTTIGKKVPGPLVADKDEPFMKGEFTSQEFSELESKVASEIPSTVEGWLIWGK